MLPRGTTCSESRSGIGSPGIINLSGAKLFFVRKRGECMQVQPFQHV